MQQCLQGLRFLALVKSKTKKEQFARLARILDKKFAKFTEHLDEPRDYDFEAALKMNARKYPLPSQK
jgi:hypothetical protein